ncbi:MAG: hypothetical protein PVI43_00485 [Candidatus Bathyarchaeota archaeon]|jgi:hypothetical protein
MGLSLYLTESQMGFAESLGFTVADSPMVGVVLTKGKRNVWPIKALWDGEWQTADLIDGHYYHHQKFKTLEAALMRPL